MRLFGIFGLLSALISSVVGENFTNPILWQDLADVDIIRVNQTYYYSASTMHYSPGAPILRSYDLVNWEYIGHSVPVLDFRSQYDLIDGHAYRLGVWASSMQYRKSNGLFYWIGCVDFWTTYIYTAPAATGPWTRHTQLYTCYYDAGLLFDDDGNVYVSHAFNTIKVAQLSQDARTEIKVQEVFPTTPEIGDIEGSRFYKINGEYYIFVTHPGDSEYVLKSSSPWGPYTAKALVKNMASPAPGCGPPRQGGIVQTHKGDWYYMAFVDDFPGGRIPVLAPLTWGSDGFPSLVTVNGQWSPRYPYPLPKRPMPSHSGTDRFLGKSLGPQWEWNHNPDTTKFTVNNGLTLSTATVTSDLYAARNTLTHRILGPTSTATILLDYGKMKPGDRSGLVMLRDNSAWVGVKNDNGTFRVAMVSGLAMDGDWNTINTGFEVAGTALANTTISRIWLRAAADINNGEGRQAKFSYSTNGSKFIPIGTPYTLNNTWNFFMGYRYGIFNYATSELGGSVFVSSFTMNPGN